MPVLVVMPGWGLRPSQDLEKSVSSYARRALNLTRETLLLALLIPARCPHCLHPRPLVAARFLDNFAARAADTRQPYVRTGGRRMWKLSHWWLVSSLILWGDGSTLLPFCMNAYTYSA